MIPIKSQMGGFFSQKKGRKKKLKLKLATVESRALYLTLEICAALAISKSEREMGEKEVMVARETTQKLRDGNWKGFTTGREDPPAPGILQARTLEWVSISFPNACMEFQPQDQSLQ